MIFLKRENALTNVNWPPQEHTQIQRRYSAYKSVRPMLSLFPHKNAFYSKLKVFYELHVRWGKEQSSKNIRKKKRKPENDAASNVRYPHRAYAVEFAAICLLVASAFRASPVKTPNFNYSEKGQTNPRWHTFRGKLIQRRCKRKNPLGRSSVISRTEMRFIQS